MRISNEFDGCLDWQNHSESMVRSLQADDNEQSNFSTEQPFYLNRQTSIERSLGKT